MYTLNICVIVHVYIYIHVCWNILCVYIYIHVTYIHIYIDMKGMIYDVAKYTGYPDWSTCVLQSIDNFFTDHKSCWTGPEFEKMTAPMGLDLWSFSHLPAEGLF